MLPVRVGSVASDPGYLEGEVDLEPLFQTFALRFVQNTPNEVFAFPGAQYSRCGVADFTVQANAQGSFTVDTGTDLSTESPELNTYVIFDSAQIGVTSVQINMSGSSQYGLDELEVYSAVPEPSSVALLLGLGSIALVLRRRK